MRAYAELAVTTNFSFLRGASHPEEIVAQAAALGLSGIGIADHNSFAGVVRAHVALREWRADQGRDGFADLQLAIGVRLVFADDTPDLLAYPRDRAAYGRLCRLLTLGKRRAPKGACHITRTDLAAHAQDVQFIVMAGGASMKDAPELPSPWWRGVGGEGGSESDSPVMTGADAINGRDPSSKPLTPDPSPRRERGESAASTGSPHLRSLPSGEDAPSMKDAPELPSPWWRGVGGEGGSESDSPVMTGADAINGRDPSSKPLTPAHSPRRERGESAASTGSPHLRSLPSGEDAPSMKDAPELPSPWWRGVGGEGGSESDSPVMTGADAINGRDPSSKPLTPDPSPRRERGESAVIAALKAIAPDRLWIGVSASYGRAPRHTMAARRELAQAHGLPLIAVGDVLYHEPERRALQDVVSCIRLG